jgi:hypothetical protein
MKRFIQILSIGTVLIMLRTTEAVAQNLYTASPIDFFTNVASRALSQELNLDLNQIQIYPTNQYTPAVQRLLQVAANVFDATTTNFFPSVFRPIFTNDGTNIFITGYEQVVSVIDSTDSQLGLPVDIANLPVGISTNVNVYGIPWIIGVKKGFPNFNQFSMEEMVGVERRLQVTRPTINAASSVNYAVFQTNQMYTMVITNWLGVDCWNSYSSNYIPVSGGLNIVAQDSLSMTLTNDNGMTPVTQPASFADAVNLIVWPGSAPWYGGAPNANSFDIPLVTNFAMPLNTSYPASMNWWQYSFNSSTFYPTPNPLLFETGINNNFLFPHFVLLTTNRLRVFMLDGSNVIDYVQFCGPNNSLDLKTNIFIDGGIGNGPLGVWNTNLSATGVPDGVLNQIQVSRGGPPPTFDGLWNSDNNTATPPEQQAFFAAFFNPGNVASAPGWGGNPGATASDLELSVEAPYSPIRYVVLYTTWQANDPLVHYVASDLNYTEESGTPYPGINVFNYGQIITNLPNLGALNDHYSPWGGNPLYPPDPNTPNDPNVVDAINLAVKDPLVYSSDDWNFPNGQTSNLDWIGQVHRGTPWQTIDLKSVVPDIATWANWTGDLDINDAAAMAPGQDWNLASLLVSLFNTNNLASLFSVNDPNPNDWQGLLNGLTGLTNIPDQFDSVLISSNSSQASLIANAIQSERAVQPGQLFSDVGDILATPQLSEQSPFLVGLNATDGISDVNYEIIPSQLLSLLRTDSVGSAGLTNCQMLVQFTGYDGHAYAIQESLDLVNWVSISTNYPVNGVFSFTNSAMLNAHQQFYRSVLLQ